MRRKLPYRSLGINESREREKGEGRREKGARRSE
jgi:hypothetical protein